MTNDSSDDLRQEEVVGSTEGSAAVSPETREVELAPENLSPLGRASEAIGNAMQSTRDSVSEKVGALIGMTREKGKVIKEAISDKLPIVQTSEAISHVISGTRDRIAEKTNALIGMTKEKCDELRRKLNEMLTKLPAPVATALASMITIGAGGIYFLTPNSAEAAVPSSMYEGTSFVPIDDMGNPILEFFGNVSLYALIEAVVIGVYATIGLIGYRGQAWDDAGRAAFIGLISQIVATIAAMGLSMGTPLLWGVAGGVGMVSLNAVRKLIRNQITKPTGSGSTNSSKKSPVRKPTRKNP